MSRTIDERVVEMRFDNAQFEANAKTSLTTLQRLREALNFSKSKDSLEKLGAASKVVNSNNAELLKGVSALQKRFSTFGIISMRAVENVTDSVMGLANRGVKSVTDSLVSGGIKRAMNIENAHFQLQSLLKDEKEVQKVMKNAMDSVTDTAYGYDEAAKAASMFAASGMKAGKEMEKALSGISGVAAMTNSDYASMSLIFTTVAGQGRLMGDQLLQLASRGLNAASTLKDYYKEVLNQSDMTEEKIRDLVSEGKISFKTFADAMAWAFGDSAKRANETFNGAFANMKAALARIGAEFVSPLIAQNSEIVKLFNALQKKIDVFKKGITFSDEEKGITSFSKSFTDHVLAMAKTIRASVEDVNLDDFFKTLYNIGDIFSNSFKGVWRILMPFSKTLNQVLFKDVSFSNLEKATRKLADFTAGLKLSWKSSLNLHDAYKGVFDVLHMFGDVLFHVLKLFIPLHKTSGSLIDVILALAGALGRGLTAFTEFMYRIPGISKAYSLLGKGIKMVSSGISASAKALLEFIAYVYQLPQVQFAIGKLNEGIEYLGTKAYQYLKKSGLEIKRFAKYAAEIVPVSVQNGIDAFTKKIKSMYIAIKSIDLSKGTNAIEKFQLALKGLLDLAMQNEGISAFVTHVKQFGLAVKEAFSFENIISKFQNFQSTVRSMVNWFKEHVLPLFSGFSIGGVASAASAIGLVYGLVKMSKAIESVSGILSGIPKVLDGLSGALKAYQTNLRASTLIKIAGAITLLAAALVLLSFADPKRLTIAAAVLSATVIVFMAAIALVGYVMKKVRRTLDSGMILAETVSLFADDLGLAIRNLAKAFKYRAIGKMAKDFGVSIALVVGSIAALMYLQGKDSEGLDGAVKLMGKIVTVMISIMAGMTILQKLLGKGSSMSMLNASLSVLALGMALTMAVRALRKLFKMDLPEDWKAKLGILAGIFGMLGGISILLGLAGKASGGAKGSSKPVLLLAVSLSMVVSTLNKLFKMDLPEDWKTKLGILAGIFLGLAAVLAAISVLSKGGGANVKAAATILTMCVLIGATVAALAILTAFSAKDLRKSVIALGASLAALALAMSSTSKIADPSAAKVVLTMAITIGAIAVSLSVLSLVPWQGLLKAALSLGSILLALARNFNQISKISGAGTWKTIVAMVATIAAISASLVLLSMIPWKSMLSAGAALSSVMLSLAMAFKVIGENDPNISNIFKFVAATIALVPIGVSIALLAEQPWQNVLASAASISAVLLAMTGAFVIVSKTNPNLSAMGGFLLATASVVAIGVTLSVLAEQPWQNVLASAASISAVLLAMTGALAICAIIGGSAASAISGIATLDLFIANFAAVLTALGYIFKSEEAQALLAGGSETLKTIGKALGDFVGSIVAGAISSVTDSLPKIGENLTAFMDAAKGFFDGASGIDESAMNGIKAMAETMLILTASDFISGIASFLGIGGSGSLVAFGEQLAAFAPSISEFSRLVSGIDPASIEGAAAAVKVMTSLAKNLPTEGGILGAIIGNRMDLSTFGANLALFGKAMADFSNETKGITEESVKGASDAASMLISLAKDVPTSGGILGKLFGGEDLGSFSENIKLFGKAMANFSTNISSVNTGKIDAVVLSMGSFIKMAKSANKVSTDGLTNLSNSMDSIAESSSSDYAKNMSGKNSSVGTAVSSMISKAIEGAKSQTANFKKEGAEGGEKYASGIDEKKNKASNSGKKLSLEAIKGLKSKTNDFEKSGKNAGAGYVEGLLSKIPAVRAAASKMAKASQAGVKSENNENSPSKKFRRSGIFAGTGYVIGLAKMAAKAYQAGEDIAKASISGTDIGAERFSRIFDDLDVDPIIKPTVDLRNVQDSIYGIRSMFNDAINSTANVVGNLSIKSQKSAMIDLTSAIKGMTSSTTGAVNNYNINGIEYTEGSDVSEAVKTIVRAVTVQGRV